jgi:hypothetical protein
VKLSDLKIGDLITNGSSAGKVLELVDRDPDWKTAGVRVHNIPLEQFGGNAGMSSFVADHQLGGWRIVPMEWVPVTGGSLEERYEWAPNYSRLQRQVRRIERTSVDWDKISHRLQDVMRVMLQEEGRYHDSTFYADALRRTLGYEPAGDRGFDHVRNGQGLTTESYHQFNVKGATALSAMHAEQAKEEAKELRAEVRRVYTEAGKDLAEMLRERCNERTVPSRYRREGVAWAADMIDPGVPKDQYGHLIPAGDAS